MQPGTVDNTQMQLQLFTFAFLKVGQVRGSAIVWTKVAMLGRPVVGPNFKDHPTQSLDLQLALLPSLPQ